MQIITPNLIFAILSVVPTAVVSWIVLGGLSKIIDKCEQDKKQRIVAKNNTQPSTNNKEK